MVIEIKNLSKSFKKKLVLDNISLSFDDNKIYALLGPNGSGKSTLIKSILGINIIDRGEINVMNLKVTNTHQYRKHISYMPQISNFPDNITVMQLFKLVENLRDQPKIYFDELVQLFGIDDFINKKINTLSGGMLQKVNIANAFMYDVPLYILDEPTNSLDPLSVIKLKNIILKRKDENKTIIFTSHIVSFVDNLADNLIFMLDGKIIINSPISELKQENESLELKISNYFDKNEKNNNL